MSDLAMPGIWSLLLAVGVGYLLGSVPVANWVSRRSGVNIFRTGTGLAGSTNVRRNVGRVPGAVVLLGDIAKGALSILIAGHLLSIDGAWIVVPAGATIGGHWNSIFTGFKGGDGLATLGGITLAVFPEYGIGFFGIAFASLVALGGQRFPFTSLFSIIAGYLLIIGLCLVYADHKIETAFATGALALIVFAHAVLGHAKRNRSIVEDDFLSQPDVESERR